MAACTEGTSRATWPRTLMRLVLPTPVVDRLDPIDFAPGVTLRVHRAEPLPLELERWRARVIGAARVLSTVRLDNDAGWPVTAIRVAEPAGLYAFFELFDRVVVVAVTARDAGALDAALDPVHALLRAADIDRTQREVVALAQIWADA